MFIMIEPSPEMQMTRLSGAAIAAPIAAGRPNPIVPSEPDVRSCLEFFTG